MNEIEKVLKPIIRLTIFKSAPTRFIKQGVPQNMSLKIVFEIICGNYLSTYFYICASWHNIRKFPVILAYKKCLPFCALNMTGHRAHLKNTMGLGYFVIINSRIRLANNCSKLQMSCFVGHPVYENCFE